MQRAVGCASAASSAQTESLRPLARRVLRSVESLSRARHGQQCAAPRPGPAGGDTESAMIMMIMMSIMIMMIES